jgi:ATP-binding cassette subfamily C protein
MSKLKIFQFFFTRYKRQLLFFYVLSFLNGAIEGLGIAVLFPLFTLLTEKEKPESSTLYYFFEKSFAFVGLPMSIEAILILIVSLFILKAQLRYAFAWYITHLTSTIIVNFRLEFTNAILKSKWSFYIHKPIGSFLNALFAQATRCGSAFSSISKIIAASLQALALLFFALLSSWQIVVFGIITGTLLWFVLKNFLHTTQRVSIEQKDLLIESNGQIADILSNLKPLKAMNREQIVFKNIRTHIKRLFTLSKQNTMAKEGLNIYQEPLLVLFISIALYGATNYADIEPGLIMVLLLLFYRIIKSLSEIQNCYQALLGQESFFWSMRDFIAEAEEAVEIAKGDESQNIQKSIKFVNVNFSYGQKNVLKDFNLEIPAKRLVTLKGPSGTGKTTIVDLLCRLNVPDSGHIEVDGTLFEKIDLYTWRSYIGYVPQEFVVLHDDITSNITLGDQEIPETRVIDALKQAEAWNFVKDLPDGLKTILGERGGKLSGGQRQRIALARALVQDPQLLILDEATASLDLETETEIFKTLKSLSSKITIIVVSHQETIKDYADIVIDLGKSSEDR